MGLMDLCDLEKDFCRSVDVQPVSEFLFLLISPVEGLARAPYLCTDVTHLIMYKSINEPAQTSI